jgi:hypothetical protein
MKGHGKKEHDIEREMIHELIWGKNVPKDFKCSEQKDK